MPLYEYRCQCGKKFAKLVGMTADSSEPACPKCGSVEVTRLMSRFSRVRGEDEKLDALEDAALGADPDDPAAMSRLMREMGKEMADEECGEDFEEYLDGAEQEMHDQE